MESARKTTTMATNTCFALRKVPVPIKTQARRKNDADWTVFSPVDCNKRLKFDKKFDCLKRENFSENEKKKCWCPMAENARVKTKQISQCPSFENTYNCYLQQTNSSTCIANGESTRVIRRFA